MPKKQILVSLNSCGESIEKSLSLYYAAQFNNIEFYKDYNVSLFYGHNLPKCQDEIDVHGSVGFYNTFFDGHPQMPCCNLDFLFSKKDIVLQRLVLNHKLTLRAAKNLSDNKSLFFQYISKLPIEYIYPQFINAVICKAKQVLNIYSVNNLYLEDNMYNIDKIINTPYDKYKLYTLDYSGDVGRIECTHYDSTHPSDILHVTRNKSVIASNSALMLMLIKYRLNQSHPIIVGYRPHKRQKRANREYALQILLRQYDSIIEPKNTLVNNLFSEVLQRGIQKPDNVVYSKLYQELIEILFDKCQNKEYLTF